MAEGAQRRLTTIVAADIASFSRLVGIDEEATLAAQRKHRAELIEPLLAEYHGRIANTAGDSFLFEFSSTVEAVRCAMAVQEGMAKRNGDIPVDRRIEYRIGINLGDVISDGEDLLGDGVNVAARLETLADPGSICISNAAHEQVRDRLEIAFEDLGEVEVKNIARPVRVFRVLSEGAAAAAPAPTSKQRAPPWLKHTAAGIVILAIVVAGGAWWWQQQAAVEPAARTKAAQEVPDKPSIAVLPFNNMSGEASQDSFADGISEDLTTQLSKVSGLFVISRTTAFQYKGRSANIQQLAKELGVRYVVEGSVRRAGDQLRVNAQLIDAASGGHLWAETFDGVADEVFVLQDRINTKIVTALKVRLTPDEEKRVVSRGTENVEAYDAFRRGERLRLYTKVRVFEEAEEAYNRAIELDPNFGAAYAGLSHVVWSRARSFIQVSHREVLKSVWVLAEKSIVLGAASPGHAMLANLYLWEKFDHDRSESEARRAVAIDPNNSESIAVLAEVLIYAGKLDEARANLANAMRLDPGFPGRYSYLLGQEYFHAGKYRKSLEQMMDYCEGRVLSPRSGCLHYRASALGQLGEIEAGRKIINILIGGSRGRNLASIETTIAVNFPFSNDAGREQLMEGIRKVWSKE